MTSQIRVDEITNRSGLGTVTIYDNGFEFTGVSTFTENVDIEGNLTIGGVLTYEDTTNIDSVGVITARAGVHVTGGNLGVGLNNPTEKLEVLGSTLLKGTSSTATALNIRGAGTQGDDATISFSNGYTQTFKIGMSDDIGPARDFIISETSTGSSSDNENPKYIFNGNGDGIFQITDRAGGDVNVQLSSNGDSFLSGGNIGIGENSPYYKLHLKTNNNATSLSGGSSGNWGGDGIRIENTNATVNSMSLAHFRNYDADWHIGSRYVASDNSNFVFLAEGSEKLRIDVNGNVKIGTISDTNAAVTKCPLYIAMQTDLTTFEGGEGAATTGLLRLEETGSNNNRYHGIELRNTNSGDIRILNQDVGVSDRGDLVIAMPDGDASDGVHNKIRFNSLQSSIQISGKNGAVAGNAAVNYTDIYIATRTGVTAVADGAGDEIAGLIRFEDIGSTNNRYHGFELRNRNSGDARILNLDEGTTNKSNLVFAVDNGSTIVEAMRLSSDGKMGVGTASPNHKLTLHNSGTGTFDALNITSGLTNSVGLQFGIDSSSNVFFWHTANGGIKFATNNVERMRVTNNGITFNGDTAAANALDDYEEGTWTPQLLGGTSNPSLTYSAQSGGYEKVGSLVHLSFFMHVSAVNSQGSGYLELHGLPYIPVTSPLGASEVPALVLQTQPFGDGKAANRFAFCRTVGGSSRMFVGYRDLTSGNAIIPTQAAANISTGYFIGHITYRAA